MPRGTKDDARIGGIVADRVGDDPRLPRGGIGAQDARIKDFQRRADMVGRRQNIGPRHPFARQGCLHDKGNLCLDPRLDEPPLRHHRPVGKQHVIHQNA